MRSVTPPRISILCALFAALTAALSQVSVFLGPVPFNLASFSVLLSGAVLGKKHAAVSQLVYVLMGLCGIPVFAGYQAGFLRILGPTGGYILGYVPAAFFVGLIYEKTAKKPLNTIIAMFCGFLTYMIMGTLWFMYSTGSPPAAALSVCVLPFIPGDMIKIACAVLLAPKLNKFNRYLSGG